MQNLKSIHHLVHIGFNVKKQPDFTESIKKYIESISDDVGILLNFVDESLYTLQEAEKVQKLELADTLAEFLAFYQNHTTTHPLFDTGKIIYIFEKEHPKVVLDFLYNILDGTWQKLKEGDSLFQQFEQKNVNFVIQKNDDFYNQVMNENFLDILLKMVDFFHKKNIYNIQTSVLLENDNIRNLERKQEIKNYAKKMLGEDRVIFSGMKGGEVDKINLAHRVKKGINITNGNPIIEFGSNDFGNATSYVNNENADVSIMRLNRFKKAFFEIIQGKGFDITEDTKHILGGEYYNICVSHYSYMLLLFGINENQITIKKDISLVKGR